MNNFKELNSKWYYRLIKVIYTLIFLFIFIWWLILIVESSWKKNIDTTKTKIICYSSDDRQFLFPEKHKSFTLKEVWINELESNYNLRKNWFNYENFITYNSYIALQISIFCINENNKNEKDYTKEDIKEYSTSWIDMFIWQKSYELRFWKNKIFTDKWRIYSEPTKEEKDYFEKLIKEYEDYVNSSYSDYDRASELDFSIKMFDLEIKYLYWRIILYILLFICWVYISFEIIRRLFYYIILWQFFPNKD